MRDRIIISLAILALAVMVVLSLPTGGASLVLAPGSGSSGATVRVTGSGFVPSSKGTLVWDGGTMLGDFQTSRDGTLAFSFVIPAATAGDHAVAAQFASARGRLRRPSPAVATTVMFTVTGPMAMSTPTATGSSPSAAIKPAASATPTPTKAPTPTATPKAAPSSAPVSTAAAVATPAAAAPPIPASAGGQRGFAYYYLWWSDQHWHDKLGPAYPYSTSPLPLPASLDGAGCNPKSLYTGNQLTDVPAALNSQDAPGAIEADMRQAASSGLTGFLVNWRGTGSTSQSVSSIGYNGRLAESFASANRLRASGIPFDLWVSYEAAASPLSASYITADITWLAGQFASNQAWDRSYGKPLLVWTGSRKYSTDVVRQVSAAVRNRVFLVGDESQATLDPTRLALFDGISYYWSSQDPYANPQSFDQLAAMASQVHSAAKPWFAPLTPGYDTVLLGGSTCVPRNGGQTMRDLFVGNSRSRPQAWIVISWNEIAENTYLKPMRRYGSGYAELAGSLLAGR